MDGEANRRRLIIASARKPAPEGAARGQALWWWRARDGDNNGPARNKWLYREQPNDCPKQTAPAAKKANPEAEAEVEGKSGSKRARPPTANRANLIRATILLIIGYELLAELASRHANHLAPDNRVEPNADRSCHKCLPNLVFRSCAAFEEKSPVGGAGGGGNQQEATNDTAKAGPGLVPDDKGTKNGNSTNLATTMPPSSLPPTPKSEPASPQANHTNRNRNHNHNVLCNSRCNCVLLEPLPAGPATGSGAPAKPAVAFDEDYSLDYEDPALVVPGNETQAAERQLEGNLSETPGAKISTESSQLDERQLANNGAGSSRTRLQPLAAGSGRDLNAPQLYAQSLYSGQAPKLALHAHTLLRPSQGGPLPAGSGPQDQQLPAPPSAGPQNYSPFPHSLRSNYLAHHLRTTQSGAANGNNKNNISNNSSPNNANNGQLPSRLLPRPENFATTLQQQQRLVPLRPLDYAARLANHTAALYASAASVSSSNSNSTSGGGSGVSANGSRTDSELNSEQQLQNLNWTQAPKLIDQIESLLTELEADEIQSLSLSRNDLRFELWSELYALLATALRQHLYQLNLSHNNLVKLGVTFTGYLEHHLALHNNSWPFGESPAASPLPAGGGAKPAVESGRPLPGMVSARLKHTLLGAGKLYSMVQSRLQAASFRQQAPEVGANSSGQLRTGSLLLQQPMVLRALDLSHNKLKWLINDQFRTLKHLQTIRLDHNRIRYIHQHAFSGLESLRFLNLNFNRLQVIYIEQFQTNYNLLALMLRANSLAYLRGGSFSSLANLKRLDLSQNKLTIMSSNALVGLESLELLNCSSNQFAHAPSASLHPLTSLRQLDLSENFITQLAPGTFFHLPLEELWLERNEQLVAIERGAFWDLPYLKRLHLNWNPMLMGVNSQAFVGSQSLQAIGVEGCQALEPSTRQMLENVTLAATSRLLRLEQQQQQAAAATANKSFQQFAPEAPGANATSGEQFARPLPTVFAQPVAHINRFAMDEPALPAGAGAGFNYKQLGAKLNYASYLATLALLVVVLKLIFKFTASSRYLEARRRRRRVYEEGSSFGSASSADESPVSGQTGSPTAKEGALEMCEQVIFAAAGEQQNQPAAGFQYALPVPECDNGPHEEEAAGQLTPPAGDPESVIPEPAGEPPAQACDCPDCPQAQPDPGLSQIAPEAEAGANQEAPSSPAQTSAAYQELIQRQLLAAGLDYGHANCAHFYQSLQLADMTGNFMDFYP